MGDKVRYEGAWVDLGGSPAPTYDYDSPFMWFDASDASSITTSSSEVTQWSDKSGNGYHLTPSGTPAPRHNVRTMNGLPVVTWDSTYKSTLKTANTDWSSILTTASWFAVVEYVPESAASRVLVGVSAQVSQHTNPWLRWGLSPLSTSVYQARVATNVTSSAYLSGVYTPSVLSWNSSTGVAKNGNRSFLSGPTGPLTYAFNTAFMVGGTIINTENFQGSIAELVLFNRSVTGTEETDIINYLTAKWGAGLSLAV